ncbi:MAG TPA: MoaD/ThiS family protein [Thermoplasmata archaeon]|nr:MoaD/ThiS family protein [Thermoplasmata archaeon]
MPARVTIELFASAREAAGRSTVRLRAPVEGLRLSEMLAMLTREYPKLAAVLPSCRTARNGRYLTQRSSRIRPGDEIAIHPPYSGG